MKKNSKNNNFIEYIISEESKGLRLDLAISNEYDQYSRSLIQKWIKKEKILLNGKITKAKEILNINDKVTIFPEENINPDVIIPENIEINVNYEDDDILVINKNSGIVVHPAESVKKGTIANGLVFKYPELVNLPRSGLIHRLDKDTSGLLIIAKNLKSFTFLTKILQERKIFKQYIAIVHGRVMKNDIISKPISRHRTNRKKMSVNIDGKEAITEYEVMKNFSSYTKLKINLITGRTHQIRVHMSYLGYPLVGDQTYGINSNKMGEQDSFIKNFPRQALHAQKIKFKHPITGEYITLESELPKDILGLEKEIIQNE